MTVIRKVVLSERAERQIRKAPPQVVRKLLQWVNAVEASGLDEVRKLPGFHDEPLSGDRKGQRSIRLNRSYRAFYVVVQGVVAFASVEEVNKHDY